jgi:hypothetical protein
MNCEEYGIPAETERRLIEGLRCLGAEARDREAPARVERRLVAAFRGNSLLARKPIRWWMVGSWAAAMAVTAGLAFFLVRTTQPEHTEQIPSHRRMTQLAALEGPAEVDALDELGSDFIPLPNAQRIAEDEPVNLVRVELPRSAMLAFGLAVSDDDSEEPIEADVVLGPDGTARAVRFLE